MRTRWRSLQLIGWASLMLGVVVFIDALDGGLYFPVTPFAVLLLLEGLAILAFAWTGMAGQRTLHYVKGLAFCVAATLTLVGRHHGNFILLMIFGPLVLADGLLQIVSAKVVRSRMWRLATIDGGLEIDLAIFFYQPYPTHYVGTVQHCLGLGLMWNMLLLSMWVWRLASNPTVASVDEAVRAADEAALTVHMWTPVGSAKGAAAVDCRALYSGGGR